MSTYGETIEYLYSQLPMFQNSGPGAYKPGLETARKLDDAFGNPHKSFRAVHVAGTNGKGSVSHTIASVLQAAGLNVGLYTSPHLIDFRERIRVNGEMISPEEVVDFVDRYRSLRLDCNPSFFELTTIMAFEHFARHKVDFAIIETGLGGRLDTTNIITPVLSVITNISLDHTALLGDTIEAIAREKAGIIKPGIPVVVGEADETVREVMTDAAKTVSAPLTFTEDEPVGRNGDVYSVRPGEEPCVEFELKGDYQHANANTIMAALRQLSNVIALSDNAVRKGFSTVCSATGLMGRWQTLREEPVKVVCDTGHNIGAWTILGPKLRQVAERVDHLRMVIGFVNDKDVNHIFDQMPHDAEYYFVTPSVARGRDSSQLLYLAREKGFRDIRAFGSVRDGYEAALNESLPGDMIFVGGSTFVVADLLTHLRNGAS